MLIFAAAVFFLLITPGPGVLTAAGIGAAFGMRTGLRYIIGLFVGSNLVMLAVVTGLAALVLAWPAVRFMLLIGSTGFLTYLAARIAFAGAEIRFLDVPGAPSVGTGIMLQIINPKAYAVGTVLFSGFAILPQAYGAEVVLKLVILNAIWVPIHIGWVWAGASLRRLNLSSATQRAINIGMALALLAVVGLAALTI